MRLNRNTSISSFDTPLCTISRDQVQVDALQAGLCAQAASTGLITSMTVASAASSLGRIVATGLFSGLVKGITLKVLTSGMAFAAEVVGFRAAHQVFNPGASSWADLKGILSTANDISFLKLAGHCMGNSSFILRQGIQGFAMLGGEYAREALHLQEASNASFSERYVNAVATGFAMEIGLGIFRKVNGRRLEVIQRNLEQQAHYRSVDVINQRSSQAQLIASLPAFRAEETPTDRIVHAINKQDGCPFKHEGMSGTHDKPVAELSPAEAKEEYYGRLLEDLPDIVGITREFRRDYPLGLVEYAEPGSTQIVPAVERAFPRRLSAAVAERGFEGASYAIHDAAARSIDIATEEWLRRTDANAPEFRRLTELTCPVRQAKFGLLAAQKRISSAMIQTAHISASFQRFILRIFLREHGRLPTRAEMTRIYERSAATAVKLTEFHLLRTRPVREVLGSESFGDGIIHLYTDDSAFDIIDQRIELVDERFIARMAEMPVDTSDGRIGCPGKKHISDIWFWLREISEEHAFPLL